MCFSGSQALPLDNQQAKRFYEPLLLLCCLYIIFSGAENGVRPPDLDSPVDKNSQGTFSCFVNKLSQVCDSQRGGNTVTAFAVLQTGSIEYRFTSNQRTLAEFESTTRYVKNLLGILGGAQDNVIHEARQTPEDCQIFSTLIREVLQFNRPRITEYHIEHQFAKNLDFCISACSGSEFGTILVVLKSLTDATLDSTLPDIQFAVHGQRLLRAVSLTYNNPLHKDYLRDRTREDREGANQTPWTELYHGLGRLHSYTIAVTTFITARHRWPELFDQGFQVTYVPSSTPSDLPSIRRTSSGIIARLTNDPAVLEFFPRGSNNSAAKPAHLQDLTAELDRRIQRKYRLSQAIVHAEVHLADHILRESRTNPELRFFNEATIGRYIGASKPTCRLCHFYFSAPFASAAGRIQVRPTSHNYYHNWRVPDVYPEDGSAALQARKQVVEWMITNLKPEAARTVVERFAVKKGHDSNTYPSVPDTESLLSVQVGSVGSQSGGGESVRRLGAMEDIIAKLGGMRLGIEE
ncbi:hypothetical protein QBC36DRAFT_293307 [Triangularia setosa]|uniref:Uncharacterized protein n=1 Tax=Triangularia setosa TaxID=2587417 RepID=A0AAN6W4I6_9PEZI|nr:hypothetical protein QBC36DRAFT_293307 [Podospora setosa]